MDALYYIGSGSMRNNNELRYSLRALEKHAKDLDRVFIVGNKPAFLRGVEYIWVEDKFEWWRNAFEKTKAAIQAKISDEFLLLNDDFFMTKDFEMKSYPYFHKGEIEDDTSTKYKTVITNTKKVLQENGKPFMHYGVHCPMRINGQKYLQMEKYFTSPVSARCLYGNLYDVGGRKVTDNKSDTLKSSMTKCWSSRDWLSDEAFNKLKEIYNKPSRFEEEDL